MLIGKEGGLVRRLGTADLDPSFDKSDLHPIAVSADVEFGSDRSHACPIGFDNEGLRGVVGGFEEGLSFGQDNTTFVEAEAHAQLGIGVEPHAGAVSKYDQALLADMGAVGGEGRQKQPSS